MNAVSVATPAHPAAPEARPVIEARRLTGRFLIALYADIARGLTAIVGAPARGVLELSSLFGGISRPRSGTIRVLGRNPFQDNEVRRSIGLVGAGTLELVDARSVAAALEIVFTIRKIRLDPGAALEQYGLSSWKDRRPSSLEETERRAVALVVAFSLDAPAVLLLEEPLSLVSGIDRALVAEEISRRASQGATLVCITSSERDAFELTPDPCFLERGRLLRSSSVTSRAGDAPSPGWMIRSTSARALVSALAGSDAATRIEYDASTSPNEVFVSGRDPEAVALAIQTAADRHDIVIGAIEPVRGPGP